MLVTSPTIVIDEPQHSAEFIRLNELWISEHFTIEEPDRQLAANPFKIVTDGGHILSLVENHRVLGVCALFKEGSDRYQLARMAVDPKYRGQGFGNLLIEAALAKARADSIASVFLLSNTVLKPAIALYRKCGFVTLSEGPHPVYSRCNIVMELKL